MLGVNNQTTTIFLETVTSNKQSTILKCLDYSTNQRRDIECKETRYAGAHSETDDHNMNAACQVVQVLQSWTMYIHHSFNIVRVQTESWNITEKNSLVQQAFAKHTQWKLNTINKLLGTTKQNLKCFSLLSNQLTETSGESFLYYMWLWHTRDLFHWFHDGFPLG